MSARSARTATVTVRSATEDAHGLVTVIARSFGGGEAGIGFEQSYETQEAADERADELRRFYRRAGFTVDGVAPTGPDPLALPAPAPRPPAPVTPPVTPIVTPAVTAPARSAEEVWKAVA